MTGPAVDEIKGLRIELAAVRAVCAERERELLELKGPCSSSRCRLHYAHAGPCDTRPREPERRVGDPVRYGPPAAHGWTNHGHACCREWRPNSVDLVARPSVIARCMGPVGCSKCAADAAQFHQLGGK